MVVAIIFLSLSSFIFCIIDDMDIPNWIKCMLYILIAILVRILCMVFGRRQKGNGVNEKD